jgi:DNA-binding transcriptional regulator YdaS (Cro superfamily)
VSEVYTTAEALALLRQACQAAGSQTAWAARVGVSDQYVCDVLRGRRELGKKLATALGLIRQVRYIREEETR